MCTLMYMNLSEFRKNISKHFNECVNGRTIVIERAGQRFELHRVDVYTIQHQEPVAEIKPTKPIDRNNYCEHYQLKGQCLTKGCKYGR